MTTTFKLELLMLEPTALTDGSSDAGGGHTTLDYIPGSSLVGAFVAALKISPADPMFARVFLSQHTRFLNAHPAADAGGHLTRTLPRPLTFRVGKLDRSRLHDSIDSSGEVIGHDVLTAYFARAAPPDIMKSSGSTFTVASTPDQDCAPGHIEQIHVGIDRQSRTSQDGVLFSYEAICAGSRFLGAIQTDDEDVARLLSGHTSLTLRIGRSRGAGYGTVEARVVRAEDRWQEYEAATAPAGSCCILTLLSDYLPHLEGAPLSGLRTELSCLLGIAPTAIEARAVSTRQVQGFRGVWGLPRPPRTALSKGSVLVIRGGNAVPRLSECVSKGLGARTHEGFGRMALNWSIHGHSSEGQRVPTVSVARGSLERPDIAVSPAMQSAINGRRATRLVHAFVEAALRSPRVQRAAESLVKLPSAQTSNLRAAVSGSMSAAELGDWFKALTDKTGGDRWKKVDVPSIAERGEVRAAPAFVWESLFGGQCSKDDLLSGAIDERCWRRAVENIAHGVSRTEFAEAALARPDAVLRQFIAALMSDVSRRRNTRTEEVAR